MIYLNGSKFFSKLKLFSEDSFISSDLNNFKSKNVLVNEANLMLYIDDNIHSSLNMNIYLKDSTYIHIMTESQ